MQRKIKDYLLIVLKGMGMGAADVVPGVSGGTIAFISGIYEELIESIKSINGKAIKLLFKGGFKEFWGHVNANFLLAVFAGIGISVVSLAKLLKVLLEEYPVLVWSFFFGLIVASAIYVAKSVDKWKPKYFFGLLLGVAIAYAITIVTPAETPESYWFLFLCGSVAICAMVLPGISGAFILLLLSKYEYILGALTEMKIDILAVVGFGAVIGLISFSNLLSWLLKKYHNFTIALLSGFMIGSLNKVWPWKQTLEWRLNSHGEKVPLIQTNITPNKYSELTGQESMLFMAIALMVVGFSLIFVIETVSTKLAKR